MAIPNGLNPTVEMMSFNTGTAVITGGTATTHAAILTQLGGSGAVAPGSIYMSSLGGSGRVFVNVEGVWTPLTIN